MTLLQDDRLIRITTNLGENAFVVLSFTGTEKISGLFSFDLLLASEQNDITFEQLAGKHATVAIGSSNGDKRFFNGIITGFAPSRTSTRQGYSQYRATLQPSAWLLTQCVDCRVFQNRNVPDIIKQVIASAGQKGIVQTIDFRLALTGTYPTREICIQYNETDMAFIERLCETEGIFYYFEHQNGRHCLVFGDTADSHKPFAAGEKHTVPFHNALGAVMPGEGLRALQMENRLMTGKYSARDFNFTMPDLDMTVAKATLNTQPKSSGEIYEYPGGYQIPSSHGKSLAAVRIEARDARMHTLDGQSDCRAFSAGFTFALKGHPMAALDGKTYLLIQVQHICHQHFAPGAGADSYCNSFLCQPRAIAFRSQRNRPRPLIAGSQTAIVTGPPSEEIHTDKHGRIKVKFHWDRRSDEYGDGNMSCWIRVSQTWAGGKWGAMNIPRVGQEVIVTFLDGDPDRPIISGRVYNSKNQPPYNLPADKTKSTLMSNSTKNGQGNFNEIRFEDLTGAEEFFTHAAKDQNEVVQNDMSTHVMNDQRITVDNNRTKKVDVDQSETIGKNKTISVGNDHGETIGGNKSMNVTGRHDETIGSDMKLKVKGSSTHTVSKAKTETVTLASAENVGGAKALNVGAAYAINVIGAMNTLVGMSQSEQVILSRKISVGQTLQISASEKIEITCGKSSITMDKEGNIFINGEIVDLNQL
jgi:type VI secretion system secreted protein VgrG